MNRILYILCAWSVLSFISCAEDKGNYDYTHINDLNISEIKGNYSIIVGDPLIIKPKFNQKLESIESNFSYKWEIAGKEIATTRDLDIQVPNSLGFGDKICRYTVLDSQNNMKYFANFRLEIMNPFNWGYYFLTKREDLSTELAFYSVMNKNTSFSYATGIGDAEFGKNPISISGNGGNVKIDKIPTYCFLFDVITSEGEFPIISSETATFYPSSTISSLKFVDQNAGYKFNPSAKFTTRRGGNIFFCSNGQLIAYVKGFLYTPTSNDITKYKWSDPMDCDTGAALVYIFDQNSKKYYVAKPDITNIDLGIFTDASIFERVVPIENFPALTGHTIIGRNLGPNETLNRLTVVTATPNKLNFIDFEYNTTSTISDPNFEKGKWNKTTTIDLADADQNSKAMITVKDWFISAKNKIYIAPKDRVTEIREFVSIDKKYGDITSIKISTGFTKLIVTTYNKNSSSPRKGSVIYINASTGAIISEHQDVINECVSILAANFFYMYGVQE